MYYEKKRIEISIDRNKSVPLSSNLFLQVTFKFITHFSILEDIQNYILPFHNTLIQTIFGEFPLYSITPNLPLLDSIHPIPFIKTNNLILTINSI